MQEKNEQIIYFFNMIYFLTNSTVFDIIISMNETQVLIEKMIEKYGTRKKVAEVLGITPRYLEMLIAGDRKGGKYFLKFLKMHL